METQDLKGLIQFLFQEERIEEIQAPKASGVPCWRWRDLGKGRFELEVLAETAEEARKAFGRKLRSLSVQSQARVLHASPQQAISQARGGQTLRGVRGTFQIY